jgi:hypothetical protein
MRRAELPRSRAVGMHDAVRRRQAFTSILPFTAAWVAAAAPEPVGAGGKVTCWPSAFTAVRIYLPRADNILGSAPCN